MIAKEDENEAEVRREDQDRINQFARLNARLQENRSERNQIQRALEGLDDASTELMMMGGDDTTTSSSNGGGSNIVMIMNGEAFWETNEDDAVAMCEEQVETLQKSLDTLLVEEKTILAQQADLKTALYGRFGKSINLEAE